MAASGSMALRLLLSLAAVMLLALASLFIGVGDLSLAQLIRSDASTLQLLLVSRLPRTLAVILAGMGMAVAGMIMQLLTRNRFVEPSTAGTVESAGLGIMVATLLAPALPLAGRMGVAAFFALAGTALFLRILKQLPLRSALLVPLVGLMLGGIINALTSFIALKYDLLQSLQAWTLGDFSGVMRGRYELIWLAGALVAAAYVTADRFTVAGLGEDITTSLGLDYRKALSFGLAIIATITAVVVATVGSIPFLGLIVPNIASMMAGDNMRRSLPFVAIFGAGFLLSCDILGRVVRHPYEIPVGTVVGVIGAGLFLWLLLRRRAALG
jgi:iron complex transport system permease protein